MLQIYTNQKQECFKKSKISVIFCRKRGFSALSGHTTALCRHIKF
jgi:hypothetical protein